jgi:hypothetical protein
MPHPALALPTGYFVWSKGRVDDMSSRRCHRMTLPQRTDTKPLTSGEDVSCVVSFSGKWLAYAKARLAGGTSYHSFGLWDIHVVHIDGVEAGHEEVKVDGGYWPSWGHGDLLYYNQPDGDHTKIYRVDIDGRGRPHGKTLHVSTRSAYETIAEVNQCFLAPDGSWFAGRTRGPSQNGVGAFSLQPPEWHFLGKAGSVGCMPYVAPDGRWALLAGSTFGVRWGDAPGVPDRRTDQLLIPAKPGGRCYHPGISTDGKWVMTGHSDTTDHNSGPWEIYVYNLDPATKAISDELKLTDGGFNGWPHIWVQGSDVGSDASPDVGCAMTAPNAEGTGLWLLLLTLVWAHSRAGRP